MDEIQKNSNSLEFADYKFDMLEAPYAFESCGVNLARKGCGFGKGMGKCKAAWGKGKGKGKFGKGKFFGTGGAQGVGSWDGLLARMWLHAECAETFGART